MIIGSIGGIVSGLSQPFFSVLFGQMLDALNNPANSLTDEVNKVVFDFLYVAAANILVGFLQVNLFSNMRLNEYLLQDILLDQNWGETSTKVS